MNRQTLTKNTLCLLMALVCGIAWAQTNAPVKQTSAPADGYYLMYSESSSGSGWVHYDKSLAGRKYRVATDVDLSDGVNADQAIYVWKLVNDNENGTFTLQNVGENVYMPADASRGGNMGATTTANLKITAMGGEGNEGKWYVTQSNNKYEGQDLYIHTNSPGGYPNLSYYNGHSATGTSIRAQFYKVPETTYTVNFKSGEELVKTITVTYPEGFDVPEALINDAMPEGYFMLSRTLAETTYTVNIAGISTSTEMHFYRIKNFRSKKYAAYTGDKQQLAQTTELTPYTIWYVTADGGNYKLHNVATDMVYASVSSFTANGATVYIKENPYKAGYVCVSTTENLSSNCWDDQSSKTLIGNYNPRNGDADGTSWTFEEVTEGVGLYSYTLNEPTTGTTYNGTYICYTYNDEKSLPRSAANAGAKLTDCVWGENTLTANIAFPFPVSSEEKPQAVVISAYNGTKNPGEIRYYVDGTNVKAKPSSAVTENKDKWEIYPTLADGKFTFIIKNVGTGKYIQTSATSASHDAGTVTVVEGKENATSFTWVEGNRFRLPTETELYLSAGSSGTSNQDIGVFGYNSNNGGPHYGISNFVYKSEMPYVLTDADGNEYEGNFDASQGNFSSWITSFSGCDNISISDKQLAEDGTKLTATITFPFPVSKEGGVTNTTMIANGASWGNPNSRKWRAVKDNSVDYVKVQTTATNLVDASQWLWAIYPELNNGAFSFKIKNIATGKYVYANPEATGGTNDVKGTNKPITLSDTGTAFSYKNRTGSNYHFEYTNTAGTTLRPSMNGSGDTDVFLGVYSGSHSGNDVCFPNPMEHTEFPFPVSTAETTNATLISSFNANGYTSENFKWQAEGTNILVKKEDVPSLQNLNQYYWAIYPTLDERGFTFVIKNIGTGKYIYSTSNENSHNSGIVTLADKGSDLTFESNNRFKLSTNKYLSAGNSSASTQYIGTWDDHKGCYLKFFDLSTYTVTIPTSGYSAIYTPIAVTIPDGVKVYAGKVDGNWVVPSEVSGTVIPANTAVILKGTAAGTYTFNKTDDDAEAIADNDLKGSSERVTLTEEQGYTMPADAAAFKMQVGDIAPYTAYITRPLGSAKELGIFIKGYILGSHEGFVNEGVYTFVTARGWMGAKNDNNNVISTAKTSHGLTGSDADPMFQWSVYKSKNGYYYLYNLGKKQFMGVQSSNNTSIPFAATPNNRKFTFKKSSSSTHPIMFSTDNAGVANHSADFGDGLITWTGGWNNLNDGGSNHQVTLVDKLTEANLSTIAEAVEAYEAELKSQAIEALGTAITTAQPKRNGMGGGLGYYSSTDVNATTTFDAIVEFKNSITDETTINAIEGHTKTVNELFTLNVPQPGKFYRIKNNAGNGYLSSGESGRTQFKAGIENDANSIFLYIDGKLLSYENGMYIHNNGGQLKYADNIGEGIAINFVSSLEPGKLQIHYYTTENRYLYSGGTGNTDAGRDAANTTEARYRFTVEEVTSLPVTISAAGYTTLYAPVALEIDADVEAYVVSEVQSSSVLLEQVTGIVPAETGLIIKGDQGEYSFSIGGEATAEITTNELKGTVAKSLITPEDGTTCYVLANPQGGNGVGLYKASLNKNEGTAFINNGCKVYLPVEDAGDEPAAEALVMRFGRGQGTTEIELPTANGQQPTAVYDLQGRRVLNPTKGIYIVNGKKVVIR